jgi:hypothetical protein
MSDTEIGSFKIPLLKGESNYSSWKSQMSDILAIQEYFLDVVEGKLKAPATNATAGSKATPKNDIDLWNKVNRAC